jgi:signal transduction histidine kinase
VSRDEPGAAGAAVHLLLDHARNRELLADWLDENYDVSSGAEALDGGVDLCLVDESGFTRHRDRLRAWKSETEPVFAPVLLLSDEPPGESVAPDAWQTIDGLHVVDDIVSLPAEQAVLDRRIANLVERRTLSRRLDTQYRQSAERFSSLFRATPDPALVLDADGTVGFVNDAFCAIAGVDRETLVGSPLSAIGILPAETVETVREAAKAVASSGSDSRDADRSQRPATGEAEPFRGEEVTYLDDDGGRRTAEINVAPLDVAGTEGAVVVLHDITERRERERELERQNERLDEFAGIVSHDLRNPIQVVRTRAETLDREGESEHVDAILDAADRMEELVDGLLALAREGEAAADSGPVSLRTVAREAWQSVETGSATLDVRTDTTVYGDRSRIRQLFENLFRNALTHGDAGATVTVGTLDGGFFYRRRRPGHPRSGAQPRLRSELHDQ